MRTPLALAASAACLCLGVGGASERPAPRTLDRAYGRLPLAFEPNVGQTDPRVDFVAHSREGTVFLTREGATVLLGEASRGAPRAAVRVRLVGAAGAPEPGERLPGTASYFLGSDPSRWRAGVPTYRRVGYRGALAGVDLAFYGSEGSLEYDLALAPGADPDSLRLELDGADEVRVDAQGDLRIRVAGRELVQRKARVYQGAGAARREVPCAYAVEPSGAVRFVLAPHAADEPLLLDPVLQYSTFLGGQNDDYASAVAIDAAGAAYTTGFALTSFPTTRGALQVAGRGGREAFVAKVNPAGSAYVYATYLGGSGDDEAHGIAVDAAGNAYVAGSTTSTDFPATAGAAHASNAGGSDAFLVKLNPAGGALVYGTYLGGAGDEIARAVALDASGGAVLAGDTASTDFPTSAGVVQRTNRGAGDGFVARVDPTGATVSWATYLGGAGADSVEGLALDGSGNVFVAGSTASSDFPATAGALQTRLAGGTAAFAAKLNAAATALSYATYLGASGATFGHGLAIDAAGRACVVGATGAADFPTTTGAYQRASAGGTDAFAALLDAAGATLVWASYLGGVGEDGARAVALDASGAAYVVGYTSSTDFPLSTNVIQVINKGDLDAFAAKLSTNGTVLGYSTYIGGARDDVATGVAVDAAGDAYVTGYTVSGNFPSSVNALQPFNAAGVSGFLAKLTPLADNVGYATFLGGANGNYGFGVQVDATGAAYLAGEADATSFPASVGTVQPSNGGGHDAYVVKVAPDGSALLWSTYVGGSGDDSARGVAVDAAGNAYVVGYTESNDFPATAGVVQAANGGTGGTADVFVLRLRANASALDYATYLGGSDGDYGQGVAVDGAGNAYVAGYALSHDFPVTDGGRPPVDGGLPSTADAFVAELNPKATALVYSTCLGGIRNDLARSIALDAAGNAYVTGDTGSDDFPTTAGALRTTYAGGVYDAFAAKLLPGGAPGYVTFLGGTSDDYGYAVAVNPGGEAYFTGYSTSLNFPTTPGALQTQNAGGLDIFVVKMNAAGSALVYGTMLGGQADDVAHAIAIDAAGNATVVGDTISADFPVTPDAFQPALTTGGGYDALVATLDPSGKSLVHATFLGGAGGDYAYGVALDADGGTYVTGYTASANFPTTPGVPQANYVGGYDDVFLAKFVPDAPVADAGLDGGLDAGPPDAGNAPDAGAAADGGAAPPKGGCGCTPAGAVAFPWMLALGALAALSRRRAPLPRARPAPHEPWRSASRG